MFAAHKDDYIMIISNVTAAADTVKSLKKFHPQITSFKIFN